MAEQTLNHFDKHSAIHDIVRSIEDDGYAIIEGLLDEKTLNDLRKQINEQLTTTKADSQNEFMGADTQRFGRLLVTVPDSRAVVQEATIQAVLNSILLKLSPTYQIHFTGVMHVNSGAKAQALHRDQTPFPNPSPIVVLACMWAISDFNEDNGATVIVPGSHKWKDGRQPKRSEIMQAIMPAGSVLLYAGNLIHGAGPSIQNNCPRTGMAVQYSVGWLRQEENQYLAVPLELARTFNHRLQQLMGYDLAAMHWGYVGQVHPLNYLNNIDTQGCLDPTGYEFEGRVHKLNVSLGDLHQNPYYSIVED